MRILLINQFFWPDVAATSQFLEDLARHLAGAGHSISVICSTAVYARATTFGDPPPVTIYRLRGLAFSRSITGRALSYASFFLGALWKAVTTPRYDIVVTLTTPPMLPLMGTLIKTLKRSRHYIWEMDLFPEALVSITALAETSVFTRILGSITDYSHRRSDGIIVLGQCMRERLLKRGISQERIHIAENWADGERIRPTPVPDESTLRIVYSGTFGLSHDVETIARTMELLNNDQRFRFIFIGGGAARLELETRCQTSRIGNVEFLPFRNRDQIGDGLAAGHIGLVTMKEKCAGTVVPSKVYGLMAAERPVLFIGPRHATPALLIEKHRCGWQVDCGDVDGLVRLLETLSNHRNLLHEAGSRAREAFVANYDLKQGVRRISSILGLSTPCDDVTSNNELSNNPDCFTQASRY